MIVRSTPESVYEALSQCIDALTLMRQRGTCYGTGIGAVIANVTNKLNLVTGNLSIEEANKTLRPLDEIEAEHLAEEAKHSQTYNGGTT